MNTATDRTRFQLGQVVATPGIMELVPRYELFAALARHQHGDWGDVSEADKRANNAALRNDERILSVYRSSEGTKFWIITEADRSYTTVLLPSDY